MKFNYYEPIASNLPNKITIDEVDQNNNINEAILIRLLSGTLNFCNLELNNRIIKQRVNYFKFTYEKNKRASASTLANINSVYTTDGINQYLMYSQNKDFFKELLHELSCSFYFKERESHTTSFIHIYRFLEHMSITFPLFYASISKDYNDSFFELKKLFNDNSNGSGLNFNKIFFTKLFDLADGTIPYNNRIEIDFSYLDEEDFKNIKNACLVVIRSESKKLLLSEFNFDNKIIRFPFSYMHDLIITFRNRFFHYMPTNVNISSTYFVSEIFFKEFNDYAINWIGYLFNEITEKRIEKLL